MVETHTSSSHSEQPLSALVVGFNSHDLLVAVETLSAAGFLVSPVDRFETAKGRLSYNPPSILITAVKLGEFNGLHLVLEARAAGPVAAIVTSDVADRVLERDAEQLGATFLVQPVSGRELLAAVVRTVFRCMHDPAPIRAPFERRQSQRRIMQTAAGPDRRNGDRRRERFTLIKLKS